MGRVALDMDGQGGYIAAKTGRADPSRSNYTGKLPAAFVGLTTIAAAVIALFK